MSTWIALAKIEGKLREIYSSGAMYSGADDYSLWYWNKTPVQVCRAEPYSYPEDLEMAGYVGMRVRTDQPGCENAPIGQVTIASRLEPCLLWLEEHADLGSIRSAPLLEMVMQRRMSKTKAIRT